MGDLHRLPGNPRGRVTEPHPWRRSIAWLAFLGPFFFASYGFANWLASRHTHVGFVAFAWERSIPFVPWTIVPYWTIDLLYTVSVLVCTTRKELDRQGLRLVLIQLISIFFFITFPLRFSFDRPHADGVFGALFTALGSFDKPFNQAPSLHMASLVVVWVRLNHHLRSGWRWVLHAWMILIGVSVLTTYQHHFIDLPTGLAVGFFALWAIPEEDESPLRGAMLTTDGKRRRLALLYAAGAFVCAAIACIGGGWLWFFWPALAVGMVSLNYAALGVRGFQKGSDGRLSIGARGLFAPYTVSSWLSSRLWTRNHPAAGKVADGVWIGRIPGPGQAGHFAAVVDLCAELPCGDPGKHFYRSLCVLDLTVPSANILRDAAAAIETARQHGPVLVCCALGYSRSAASVVAWLLTTHRASTVEDAVRMVRNARPAIRLRREHFTALEGLV